MAYNTAVVLKNEGLPNGNALLTALFTGDAGEEKVERSINLDGTSTEESVKSWARGIVTGLNNARVTKKMAKLQEGQPIDLTPPEPPIPPDPPPPTPKEQFAMDVYKLKQMTIAINLKVKTDSDPDYTAQLASVIDDLGKNAGWVDVF